MKAVDLRRASAAEFYVSTKETRQTSRRTCLNATIALLSEKWLCLRLRALSETPGSQSYSVFTPRRVYVKFALSLL